jgi:hypothetical protein
MSYGLLEPSDLLVEQLGSFVEFALFGIISSHFGFRINMHHIGAPFDQLFAHLGVPFSSRIEESSLGHQLIRMIDKA